MALLTVSCSESGAKLAASNPVESQVSSEQPDTADGLRTKGTVDTQKPTIKPPHKNTYSGAVFHDTVIWARAAGTVLRAKPMELS